MGETIKNINTEKETSNSKREKSAFIREEHTEVSEYYRNYSPDPFKTWLNDTFTKAVVIVAVAAMYLVVAHIFNCAINGADVSPTDIVNAFSH